MAKNLMGKSRKPGNAYAVVERGGWRWEMLKLYKSLEASKADKFARVFCLVKSPFVLDGEYGDVYLADIPFGYAALRDAWVALETAAKSVAA